MREFSAFLTKPIKASQLYNTRSTYSPAELGLRSGRDRHRSSTAETTGFGSQRSERLPVEVTDAAHSAGGGQFTRPAGCNNAGAHGYRLSGCQWLEVLDALRRQPYDVI